MDHQQITPKDRLRHTLVYLACLAGGDPRDVAFCFQTFVDQKKGKSRFRPSHKTATFKEVQRSLHQRNRDGHGIYATVNATDGDGRAAENVTTVRALYADFDEKDGQRPPQTFPLPPTMVVRSKGGPHPYWCLDKDPGEFPITGMTALEAFSAMQKAIIRRFDSDPRVHDLPRVMRVPGFQHLKDPNDPYDVRLVDPHVEPGARPRYTWAEIFVGFGFTTEEIMQPTPAAVSSSTSPIPTTATPLASATVAPKELPPVEARLAQFGRYMKKVPPAVEGQGGDAHSFTVGRHVGDFGLTIDEAWPVVTTWNATCSPPWAEHELRDKLTRACATRTAPFGCKLRRNKVTITSSPDLDTMVDQAVQTLAQHPDLYRRDGMLVEVRRGDDGAPKIVPVGVGRLRYLCAEVARWGEAHDEGWRPTMPPKYVLDPILAHPAEQVRKLAGVVEVPVLRPDGSVLQDPGYDEQTSLLFEPNVEVPPIPHAPSKGDAVEAVKLLLDLVADFPFRDDVDRAAWLAGLLTPLARPMYSGPSPLFAYGANVRGSGKTFLADIISLVVTGRPMPRIPPSKNDEEERKRITSVLVAGRQVALIDNVASVVGSAALDALLTAPRWEDRILGASTMASLEARTCWYLTGNNLQLRGDTSRRVLLVRLESEHENPEERSDFQRPDLRRYIVEHRGQLLAAVLTVLRGFCAAGSPDQDLPAWGSYEGWSMVRRALVWAGLPDPNGHHDDVQAHADTGKNALALMLRAWAAAQTRLADLQREDEPEGMSAARAIEVATADRLLAEALETFCTRVTTTAVGRRLANVRNRVVDSMKFTSTTDRKKRAIWAVVDADGRPVRVEPDDGDAHDSVIDLMARLNDVEPEPDPVDAGVDFAEIEAAIDAL